MIRGILRNVQFYLLFFSVVLVLIAFQRLQWYDQGLLSHPYYIDDAAGHHGKFSHDGGISFYRPSSPSGDGRYGRNDRRIFNGEEEKEIGLFKFRVGLFKFVFPTFSNTHPSNSMTSNGGRRSSLVTVPPPPRRERKIRRNKQSPTASGNKPRHRPISENDVARGSHPTIWDMKRAVNIAYVFLLPPYSGTNTSHTGESGTPSMSEERGQQFLRLVIDAAAVVKKSIHDASTRSGRYGYTLYALDLNGGMQSQKNGKRSSNKTRVDNESISRGREALVSFGFEVIDCSAADFFDEGKTGFISPKASVNQTLGEVLIRHPIIVQSTFDSILLQPLDELFDTILARYGRKVDDPKKDTKVEEAGRADAFVLRDRNTSAPSTNHVYGTNKLSIKERGLFIFRTDSVKAYESYKKLLASWSGRMGGQNAANPNAYSRSWPTISRKRAKLTSSNVDTNFLMIEYSLGLDRCLYDAGSSGGGASCPHRDNAKDVRVARFATAHKGEGQADRYCDRPWDCIRTSSGNPRAEESVRSICIELHREWFRLRSELDTISGKGGAHDQKKVRRNLSQKLAVPGTFDSQVHRGYCDSDGKYVPLKIT